MKSLRTGSGTTGKLAGEARALALVSLVSLVVGCLPGGVGPPTFAADTVPTPTPPGAAPVPHQEKEPQPLPCDGCGLDLRPANLSCRAVAPPPELAQATLAFPQLPAAVEPVMVAHDPSQNLLMLVERAGVIHRFENHPGAKQLTEVLDLRDEVDARGDAGLVAAALHPQFADNGQIFLSYTAFGGRVTRSRVTRYTSGDGGRSYDPESRRVLIDLDQTDPWRIHLNADMKFGPDGFLYVGFGDGGPQEDPEGHAQSLESLRGKILRIDVNRGYPYAIPADNPLLNSGGRPEIFALGLRNPWRFSFDPHTGLMWVGDVGLTAWEEIDQVAPGANLGWPILEGTDCLGLDECEAGDTVAPVAVYAHEGGASVVGGFVYQGRSIPSLTGRYVFADYARGDVWALTATGEPVVIARTGLRIVSFAEEPSGELLMVDFSSGRLFRLVPQAPLTETLADRLSATGCFLTDDPGQPAPGLVEFEVRVPFWSDGAAKRRFMALPEGKSAQIRADGSIRFPVGSVLAKEFFLGGQRIETRLMMKYREGLWTGASYVWHEDGRDARLLKDSDQPSAAFEGVQWSYPSRATCLDCHNTDRALGVEVGQLDLFRHYPETDRYANQLETLRRIGILEGDIPAVARLPQHEEDLTFETQARAYLHVNCAICHTRNGPTPVDMDLRFGTPLSEMRVCGVPAKEGDLGVLDARRLSPGAPELSLLSRRMRLTGPGHMPPVGSRLVDEAGADTVDAWITRLRDCP